MSHSMACMRPVTESLNTWKFDMFGLCTPKEKSVSSIVQPLGAAKRAFPCQAERLSRSVWGTTKGTHISAIMRFMNSALSGGVTGTRAAASRLASATACLTASSLLCCKDAPLGESRMKSREHTSGDQNRPPVSSSSSVTVLIKVNSLLSLGEVVKIPSSSSDMLCTATGRRDRPLHVCTLDGKDSSES